MIKDKIEELKIEIQSWYFHESTIDDKRLSLNGQNNVKIAKEKILAYEEAQKIFDETLKNIIDEIDELDIREILHWRVSELRRYEPQIPQVKANKIKYKIKQIIQKHKGDLE